MSLEVEFTADGYLRLPGAMAARYFPADGVLATILGPEIWLRPTQGNASGGFLLKQRNLQGDKTVLLSELLRRRSISGSRPAFWDENQGVLRVALEVAYV